MAQSISFINPGKIDPRLITTLGVNVKPTSDSPIGYFGTGLKYAIAVLLREHQSITIWSGEAEYKFGLSHESIRGKDFSIITMEASGQVQTLGFTTEFGKNWTLRHAYRELYCNALDEGGQTILGEYQPSEQSTVITVTGEDFYQAHLSRDEFLLNPARRLVTKTTEGELYSGASKAVFYRGIAARGEEYRATYNITKTMKLTEDRILQSDWDVRVILASTLAECSDESILMASLQDELGAERMLYFDWTKPSEAWFQVMSQLARTKFKTCNQSALKHYYALKGRPKFNRRTISITPAETAAIEAAVDFWERVGFEISTYPINIVHALSEQVGTKVLACADDGQIWLTPEVLTDEQLLREAIIEEYIHLKCEVRDESREMQNVLFRELTRLASNLQPKDKSGS